MIAGCDCGCGRTGGIQSSIYRNFRVRDRLQHQQTAVQVPANVLLVGREREREREHFGLLAGHGLKEGEVEKHLFSLIPVVG